jgi:hypothetical protein
MRRWFEVALSETRIISPGDIEELYLQANESVPPLPFEEFHQLIMNWVKAGGETEQFTPAEQRYLDWFNEQRFASQPTSTDKQPNKMLVYRIAAALFNNQLSGAQSRGERLASLSSAPEREVSGYQPDPTFS